MYREETNVLAYLFYGHLLLEAREQLCEGKATEND